MKAPRERRLHAPDGRALQAVEYGSDAQPAVLFFNGTPGSRRPLPALLRAAHEAGLRLVLYDRPGYGRSDPQPGRTVAGVAVDVRAVAEQLKIRRLAVVGHSGGGPHALACAALLPDLAGRVATIASVAPYGAEGLDFLAGMGEENVVEFEIALNGREPLEAAHRAAAAQLVGAGVDSMLLAMRTLVSPADAAALDDLGPDLLRVMAEGLRPGVEGWVEDDLAFIQGWGFEVGKISVPVQVWHGEQDLFVPAAHGRWLAERIPNADARIEPAEGHLSLLRRLPEILDWCRQGVA